MSPIEIISYLVQWLLRFPLSHCSCSCFCDLIPQAFRTVNLACSALFIIIRRSVITNKKFAVMRIISSFADNLIITLLLKEATRVVITQLLMENFITHSPRGESFIQLRISLLNAFSMSRKATKERCCYPYIPYQGATDMTKEYRNKLVLAFVWAMVVVQ